MKNFMKSIYGNTLLLKSYCPICKAYKIVVDGILTCCDIKAEFQRAHSITKRETIPEQQRKRPPLSEKQKILIAQNYSCLYCGEKFGSYVIRNDKPIKVKVNFDHVVPYAFAQNNNKNNFVAACSICNGIKSDFIFETFEEMQAFILKKRELKKYISLKKI